MASREQIRFSPSRLLKGIWQNDPWETLPETGVLWNEWSHHQLGPIMSDTRLHHWKKIVTYGQLLNDFIKALQMINIIHISNDQTLFLERGQHLPICIIAFHFKSFCQNKYYAKWKWNEQRVIISNIFKEVDHRRNVFLISLRDFFIYI